MHRDASSAPNATTPHRPRVAKVKHWAQENGFPYTTVRDAALRGEIPLIRIGRALYMEQRDGDRWIETRKEIHAA
jgi:hypothetical protein